MMATPDRLEQYLQRVCRSMGGPRALRDHVRQELREHILDAASEHRAAGLSEDAALEKALTEFGEPDAVRSELEATHGHRALAVVIDKAMAWKEKTMKAKWLWSTWAHLAVVAIVVLEILFCWFSMLYLVPKIKKLQADGLLERADGELMAFLYNFLGKFSGMVDHINALVVLVAAALWGLFEWRFKGENKTFIRLSVLGTIGAALMVVIFLLACSMVIPNLVSMPGLERPPVRPWVKQQVEHLDVEMGKLKTAMEQPDWVMASRHAEDVGATLRFAGSRKWLDALKVNVRPGDDLEVAEKAAWDALRKVDQAIQKQDRVAVGKGLEEFDQALGPIRWATKRWRE
jgi:hypothetical protein